MDKRRELGQKIQMTAVNEMVDWIHRIGYQVCDRDSSSHYFAESLLFTKLDDLDRIKIIHVAGTKGKGSTCAYVDSCLRHIELIQSFAISVSIRHLIWFRCERGSGSTPSLSQNRFSRDTSSKFGTPWKPLLIGQGRTPITSPFTSVSSL